MNSYYKPSGKFSSISFVYFLLLSITVFPLLGLIYTYCIWYIPFIYINFFITAGFGFLVGFFINTIAIAKGKVRNTGIALVLGLLGGLIALYFHWAVWIDLVINAGESYGNSRIGVTVSNIKIFQVFSLVTQPEALFGIIGEVNKQGTWGIGGSAFNGTPLSIVWGIELLIVVVISVVVSYIRAKQPFCEVGNSWFKEIELGTFQYIENAASVVKELEKNNSELIENIEAIINPKVSHSIFTLYTSNLGESYLSIENKEAKTDKKGDIDFEGDLFLEYISINNSLKESLLDKQNAT